MSLHVKKASLNDASLLADIGSTTFYDTFHSFHTKEDMEEYLQTAYSLSTIQKYLQDPTIYYAIAYHQETPVGYLKLKFASTHSLLKGKQVELEKIYVVHAEFGKGAGKLLIDHALELALENKCDTMFLGVWEENHRAVAFYKKYGFEVFTTRTFQLGQNLCDDFLMKKELKSE